MQTQTAPQNQTPLQTRIIRLPEVMKLTGKARAQIYSDMKTGAFPQAFKIGSRAIGWSEQEIHQWIRDRIAQARKS